MTRHLPNASITRRAVIAAHNAVNLLPGTVARYAACLMHGIAPHSFGHDDYAALPLNRMRI